MHINELPDLILVKFFQNTCDFYHDTTLGSISYSFWKHRLVLLSVCRVWRELALPIVHRESIVTCIRRERAAYSSDYSEYSNESDIYDKPDCNDSSYFVKSNLDIIADTRSNCWPRIIQVFIEVPDDAILAIRDILEKLRPNTRTLDNVHKVTMVFRVTNDTDTTPRGNYIDVSEASALGAEFCKIVPSVQFLNYPFLSPEPVVLSFSKALTNGYTNSLNRIAYPYEVLENENVFTDTLTNVAIEGGFGEMERWPPSCSNNLKVVMLRHIRSRPEQRFFQSESDPQVLSFSNLKLLSLDVDIVIDMDDEMNFACSYPTKPFKFKIFAPRLEKVRIQLCPYTLSILASIQGLSVIKRVELDMDGQTLYISGLNIDIARGLFSRYAKESNRSHENVDINAYLNDILSIEGLAESTRLEYQTDYIALATVWAD